MKFQRLYSSNLLPVSEQISWRWLSVKNEGAGFSMNDIEVPSHWSDTAATILAQKYFRKAGVPFATRYVDGEEFNRFPQWLRPSVAASDETGSETSAKQTFHRMAGCWTYWGWYYNYFTSREHACVFYDEVYMMLALQVASPNSPQWFNTGLHWAYGINGPDSGQWYVPHGYNNQTVCAAEAKRLYNSYERPQPHACFIQPVADDLVGDGGILSLLHREARLFKHGSGTGSNFSSLRGKGELLSGGGKASGLISFLEIFDRNAGSIQSGGTTRRAAKMVIVDADHPEIFEFSNWKVSEEAKIAALSLGSRIINEHATNIAEAGSDIEEVCQAARNAGVPEAVIDRAKIGIIPASLPIEWEGEASRTVSAQNANNSIRVFDTFLEAVQKDLDHHLTARTTSSSMKVVSARELWNDFCCAAWACGDPGLHFASTVNAWHTCPADGPINASNPCCFVAGTYVDTSEGFIDIAELADKTSRNEQLPMAFCFDLDEDLPDLRPIRRVWCAGSTQTLVEVRTKKGQVLRCTPEHRFLTRREEGYVAAKDLKPGTSLQKINRRANPHRSGRVNLTHRVLDRASKHGRSSQAKFVWEYAEGPVPEGYDVHHKNEDPSDDRLSNLELKPSGQHQSEHSIGSANPRYLKVSDETLIEVYDAASRHKRRTHLSKKGVSPALWNRYVDRMGLSGVVPKAASSSKEGRIQGVPWHQFVARIEQMRDAVNDSVVSVELIQLDKAVPVYDAEIWRCHNFGVRCDNTKNGDSIIVHNSEYLFLDDTACNLASLKLTAFKLPDGTFGFSRFIHAARIWQVILDISVSMASFPSAEIAAGSHNYRTTGLGYADLGGLLMRMAIPYDSDTGRSLAAVITALMTGVAYRTSAEIADELGPFPRWQPNAEGMRRVIRNHARAVLGGSDYEGLNVTPSSVSSLDNAPAELRSATIEVWSDVVSAEHFRNAQVTNIAPTGTISIVMDCDTSGMEPEYAIARRKQLAGGGELLMLNRAVPEALARLGYLQEQIDDTVKWMRDEGKALEDCFKNADHTLQIFDCAEPQRVGGRYLRPMAHVLMVAAVQPYLSGGVSKTANMPRHATVEDVSDIYSAAYAFGLKSISVYRSGSKLSQPLSVSQTQPLAEIETRISGYVGDISTVMSFDKPSALDGLKRSVRERLPHRREGGITQHVRVGGQPVYLTINPYPDGRPGEIFLELAYTGTTLRAMGNLLAMAVSVGLQYGVPAEEFVDLFSHTRFEPSGVVEGHNRIKLASSIGDYIGREIGLSFTGRDDLANDTPETMDKPEARRTEALGRLAETLVSAGLRPMLGGGLAVIGDTCPKCGGLTRKEGTCTSCTSCFWQGGGCG